jgi:hypothetical protein
MQSTLSYAPTDEDFDEAFFDPPVITMRRAEAEAIPETVDDEPEQGEP